MLPIHPVILLDEASACQLHGPRCVVADIARENNIVAAGAKDVGPIQILVCKEVNAIIKLIVCVLDEVLLRHNGDTAVQVVRVDLGMGEEECTQGWVIGKGI